MVFTNKHVTVAMLVAPILAILAWFAVGYFTSETPHAARPGESYPMVEKSNCRYDSGQCDLENQDFRLALSLQSTEFGPELHVRASHALDRLALAVADPGAEAPPLAPIAVDDEGMHWRLRLKEVPGAEQRIRLVAGTAGSSYFAESSTAFLEGYR